MMKRNIICVLLALLLLLSACAKTPVEPAPTPDPPQEPTLPSNLIGISMPTEDLWFWTHDGNDMKTLLEDADYEVDLQYAANDTATQISQIENMIKNNARLLIIAAIDVEALGTVLELAKEENIPVISYYHLITGSDAVSYYVTFDYFTAGVLQGQYIVDQLDLEHAEGKSYNIEFIAGDPDDSRPTPGYIFNGAMRVLQKYLDDGTLVCLSGQTDSMDIATKDWAPEKAQERFEYILSTYYADKPLHAVWAINDSTAQGVATALAGCYDNEIYPIITGQDCDIISIKNMLDGKQAMSIFMDTHDMAAKAAEMADAIMKGNAPSINDTSTYNNAGCNEPAHFVPSYLCAPKVYTAANCEELLIGKGGYYGVSENEGTSE